MRDMQVKLEDLMVRGRQVREQTKLMNVKVPTRMLARLKNVATNLRTTKTEVVIAILNEGLAVAEKELKHFRPPPKPVIPKERRCSVRECEREKVARNLCATHYQAQRRAGKL